MTAPGLSAGGAADGLVRTCCSQPAVVCSECVRALALRDMWGISRHPEHGRDCQICQAGPSSYCSACAVAGIAAGREAHQARGTEIDTWETSDPTGQRHVVEGLRIAGSMVSRAVPRVVVDAQPAVTALARGIREMADAMASPWEQRPRDQAGAGVQEGT